MTTTEKLAAALRGCVDELELHEKQATSDGDADFLARLQAAREALAEYDAERDPDAACARALADWEARSGQKWPGHIPAGVHDALEATRKGGEA